MFYNTISLGAELTRPGGAPSCIRQVGDITIDNPIEKIKGRRVVNLVLQGNVGHNEKAGRNAETERDAPSPP